MKNIKEYIVKFQTKIKSIKKYRQMEKEASKREKKQLYLYCVERYDLAAEHAFTECEKADTFEDTWRWFWLGIKYFIKCFKAKLQLKRIES